MDKHSQHILELPQTLQFISEFCRSQPGRDTILQLQPKTDVKKAWSLRPLWTQWCLMREELTTDDFPTVDFPNLAEVLVRATPVDSVLTMEDFAEICRFSGTSEQMRKYLAREVCAQHPRLAEIRAKMHPLNELEEAVYSVFDEKLDIRDDADPELAQIRPMIRKLEKSIRLKLDYMMKADRDGDLFQEKFITQRRDRYCVPLQRSARSRLRGVIHDESASGRTVFIEPQDCVHLGNELSSMRAEEKHIIRRILQRLTTRVRELTRELKRNQAQLRLMDAAEAIAAWQRELLCVFANEGPRVELRQSRHPLLQLILSKDDHEIMPIDLELRNPDLSVLAITGSNTGGKTIALKTSGLLCLLHQCGLPIPCAPGSSLPFFEDILADIGDEQSISQSLSTFSAHLRNVQRFLAITGSGKKCLVLLDELGSGTDPHEGGALGCAIIEKLARSASLTFITTHLGMIKTFVQETRGMVNASVRFNRETLLPEYILDVGIPGSSHALDIASRLKLPTAVIERSRSFLSEDQIKLENVLRRLNAQQAALEKNTRDAEQASEIATREMKTITKQLQELKREKRHLLHNAQSEAQSIVENARRDMEVMIKRIRKEGSLSEGRANEMRKDVTNRRDNLRNSAEKNAPKPEKPVVAKSLQVGEKVWVEKMQTHGEIKSISRDGKKAVIDLNGMDISLKTKDLGLAETAPIIKPIAPKSMKPRYKTPQASIELKVIGQRVEEALGNIDEYLANAYGAGLNQVRIVHGRGTGMLRAAIHEFLSEKKRIVKHYYCPTHLEDHSGDAVTIVDMKVL